ncbi:MAG: hypothetical protein UU78_C0026G0017, partial [Candidatus Roizmanbacteria bacterium GW2011_GWC2_41_7]
MSDTHNRLQKLKQFYTTNRRLPTYTEMLDLFDFASRNAVFKLIHKWIEEGILEKMGNRLAPTEQFFALPVLGFIQAGTPTIHGDYYSEDSKTNIHLKVTNNELYLNVENYIDESEPE